MILRAICPKFFRDSRLHGPKGSYMYNYVYLRIKASFFVFSKHLTHRKKNKGHIVLSFDLNLYDNLEQTDTTPSTQLEKSKKKDQQTKGKKKRKKKNKAQSKQ